MNNADFMKWIRIYEEIKKAQAKIKKEESNNGRQIDRDKLDNGSTGESSGTVQEVGSK